MTAREKRTLKIAGIGLSLYLVLTYGLEGWRFCEKQRNASAALEASVDTVDLQIRREATKRQQLEKLRTELCIDVRNLDGDDVVAKALTAIQDAARACSVGLGPSKEMQGSPALKELARFQLEGTARSGALAHLLYRLPRLGFPLLVDQLNIKTVKGKPGHLGISLNVVILDYQAWTQKEESRV